MNISEISDKYKDEWILVEVINEDSEGNPMSVALITHSKKRSNTYKAMLENKEKYTFHFYNGEIPDKNFAVIF